MVLSGINLKYVWNFKVYSRKKNRGVELEHPHNLPIWNLPSIRQGEPKLAHNVVLKMVERLANIRHPLLMDNFFSSIGLFMNLLSMSIMSGKQLGQIGWDY